MTLVFLADTIFVNILKALLPGKQFSVPLLCVHTMTAALSLAADFAKLKH